MTAAGSEFGFELRVCAWAEREWPPAGERDPATAVFVARQLGIKERRWDTIVVEADRRALERRARFGPDALDSDLLHVVRGAPAEWAYYRECLPEPDYPWRYVREAVHRAADRGIVETRRSGGRIELRRKWAYPDWISRIVAIENKPDLSASAARTLAGQIERDVALGLADEVWVATRATGASVEPVLFEDLPVEAGVLVVDADGDGADGEPEGGARSGRGVDGVRVAWHPATLGPETPGTRIAERPGGGEHDRSAARFEYASPEWKVDKRREIAERAYGRGWRAYAERMRTDCRHFELRRGGTGAGDRVADGRGAEDTGEDEPGTASAVGGNALLPWCGAKGRPQTATECAGSCPEFEPEPPAWRTRGWPIEGGPGRTAERLLARRRARRRPDAE
jgi:hypothetical protein